MWRKRIDVLPITGRYSVAQDILVIKALIDACHECDKCSPVLKTRCEISYFEIRSWLWDFVLKDKIIDFRWLEIRYSWYAWAGWLILDSARRPTLWCVPVPTPRLPACRQLQRHLHQHPHLLLSVLVSLWKDNTKTWFRHLSQSPSNF